MVDVMVPPKLVAPLKVTKSPAVAPLAVVVMTVITLDPAVAENVVPPYAEVARNGVISKKLPPLLGWIKYLRFVPTPR